MQSQGNRISGVEKARVMVLRALIFALLAFPAMAGASEVPLLQGWNLISMPAPPDAVAAATLKLEFFRVSGGEYEAVAAEKILPGYGYWVFSPQSATLHLADAAPASQVAIQLKRGWNAVGNPFNQTVPWGGNVRVATRLGQVPVAESGMIAGKLVQYNSLTGQYEQIVQNEQLEPYRAYLVRVKEDCDIVINLQQSGGGEPVVEPISTLPFDAEAVAQDPGTGRAIVANQVVVSVSGVSLSAAAAAIESEGGEIAGYNAALGLVQVRIPAGATPADFAQTLKSSGAVADAAPVLIFEQAALPGDPIFTDSDSSNDYQFTAINAPAAWDALGPAPAQPVIIAILDTGVNAGHEELIGRVLPGMNFADGGEDTNDRNGHGTMAAGLAAGAGNNARGAAGLCWDCRVLPVKVLADNGQTSVFTVISGIIYAADNGAKVINLSLSGPTDHGFWEEQFIRAVNYAAAKGAVVVGAAGNRGEDAGEYLPAAAPRVITVAATDANNARAAFSNYGSFIDLAAPGAQVYANNLSGYEKWSGTSVSAPLVSGAAALLAREHPQWTPGEIEQALTATAQPVQPDQPIGAGELDAAAALASNPGGGSSGGGSLDPIGGSGGGTNPGMGAAAACSVTNALDSGAGSLRNCIVFANANPGTTITFAISNSYINLNSTLPDISAANTIIDGENKVIVISGQNADFDGLRLVADNITIKNLGIVKFGPSNTVAGIRMTGAASHDNLVIGCRIGTNFSDLANFSNGNGIIIENGANKNYIGDGTTSGRNIISGNIFNGIWINGAPDNRVGGNYIGLKSNGTTALENADNGVKIQGANSVRNKIGYVQLLYGFGNVISGNRNYGILLTGDANQTEIKNNVIGLQSDGKSMGAANVRGIQIEGGANTNTIGGTNSLDRNVISGNNIGIYITGTDSNNNRIYNNAIGTDATALINCKNTDNGIYIQYSSNTIIGGTAANQGNIINANSAYGILLFNAQDTVIKGNRIGISANNTDMGNQQGGIALVKTSNTTIGSLFVAEAGENIIAFNKIVGIRVQDSSAVNNLFFKNVFYNNFDNGSNTRGLAIDLNNDGVTPNGSGPVGPNNYIDYPVLTNIVPRGGGCYDFSGTKAANSYAVIYKADYPAGSIDPDPTGYGEGYAFVAVSSSAYAGTTFTYSNLCIAGASTVAFLAYDSDGNTSEFGRNFNLTAVPVVSNVHFTENPIIADGVHTSVVTADVSYENGLQFINTVIASLSPVGGVDVLMYDDGAHSDGAAGDGKYGSAPFTAAQGTPGPSQTITVVAQDKINHMNAGYGTLNITTPADPCPGFAVTSNADSGNGTLRACIEKANGTPGAETITFSISNTTISPATTLTIAASGGPLTINAQGKNIVIDGNVCTLCEGLDVMADDVTINGLAMTRFKDSGHHAISVDADNATIQNCRIGTNWAEASGLGNAGGIYVEGASPDILDNVIVGNTGIGLTFAGTNTSAATVKRNYIGLKSDGNTILSNAGGGILITNGTHDITLGGAMSSDWNVISGNDPGYGIKISGTGTTNNKVQGCLIGTNKAGTAARANFDGIRIESNASATIGGTLGANYNVISGNANNGVIVSSSQIYFLGNHIGLNANGDGVIPNLTGVSLDSVNTCTTSDLADNGLYVGGNSSEGIKILSSTNCVINKARIGVMRDNVTAAGNNGGGIYIDSSTNITIGDTSSGGNIIARNATYGIKLNNIAANAEIIGNQIYENGQHGIVNTLSYNLAITTVTQNGLNYNISGTSTCTTTGCRVQLYRVDDTATGVGQETYNAPPAAGEGFQYLGETTATVGTGAWSFTNMPVTGGNYVTATIIKDGDTTPFCPNKPLTVPDPCPGNTVTSAANSGDGTLRACIDKANGTPGAETITFTISNTTISPASTYTVQAAGGDLTIDGTGKNIVIDGASCVGCDGFTALADDFELKGLSVTRFSGAGKYGVKVTGSNAVIHSSRIGTNFSDTAGLGNAGGIYVQGQNCYVIGNIVAGNTGVGITLDGAATNGCDIQSNYVGLKSTGVAALGNGVGGVLVQGGAHDNVIGGDIALNEGNVISGQGASAYGISITGAGSVNNTIWGNIIGLNAAGTAALPNKNGVQAFNGADGTFIGGVRASHGNVISGNANVGVYIMSTNNVTAAGNLIGLNKAGNGKIGNNIGVYASGAGTCKIGTAIAGQENYIGGNNTYGIYFVSASGCQIMSSRIGLQTDNISAAGNTAGGIYIGNASSNITIGNTTGSGNIITFSGGQGVEIDGNPTGVAISGNRIYNNAGLGILSPTDYGLAITTITSNGSNYNISGTSACTSSGCSVQLYRVDDPANGVVQETYNAPPAAGEGFQYLGETTATVGTGAWSFTNMAVTGGNYLTAIIIKDGDTTPFCPNKVLPPPDNCPGNTVTNTADSGSGALRACIEKANGNPGTTITFDNGIANGTIKPQTELPAVTANNITLDGGTRNITLDGNSCTNCNGLILKGTGGGIKNLTIINFSSSGKAGVSIDGSSGGGKSYTITGSKIGNDGTTKKANYTGIKISAGASSNTIGGTGASDGNVISGNNACGIAISDNGTNTNAIYGSVIGANPAGTAAMANEWSGVCVSSQASGNIIGGAATGQGNLISGNFAHGILLNAQAAGTIIKGNKIGTDISGVNNLKNNSIGIWISGGSSNTVVGGSAVGETNTIAFNGQVGVYVSDAASDYNRILNNKIHSNTDIGIKLDGTGANNNIAVPIISAAAMTSPGVYDISGTTTCAGTCKVQLFRVDDTASGIVQEDAATPSAGEAFAFIAEDNFSGGAWSFAGRGITGGQYITATVTDATNNTSPFAENKQLPTDMCAGFVVTTNVESGVGSLRECINKANVTPAADTITFSISNTTISPTSTYTVQAAGGPLTIDGTGKNIRIDGASCTNCDGFTVLDDGFTLKGLALTRFFGGKAVKITANSAVIQSNNIGTNWAGDAGLGNNTGIFVQGQNTQIKSNILSGNTSTAIILSGSTTSGCEIKNNNIGLKPDGLTTLGNSYGIMVQSGAHDNFIGGSITLGEGNVISGNTGHGITIKDAGTTGNKIQGNMIGTNAAGTLARPNNIGIRVQSGAQDTYIGGTRPDFGNVISGNTDRGIETSDTNNITIVGNIVGLNKAGNGIIPNNFGVYIFNCDGCNIGSAISGQENYIAGNGATGLTLDATNNCSVLSNIIGLQTDKVTGAGNTGDGVNLLGANNTTIGDTSGHGNIIAYNGGRGISLFEFNPFYTADFNPILSNRIYANTLLGIDLEGGANNILARPVISSIALVSPGIYNISGTTTCAGACKVQLFRVDDTASGIGQETYNAPPSAGEAFAFITDGDFSGGTWSFSNRAISGGQYITATVTDTSKNTSEFAENKQLPTDMCAGFVVSTLANSGLGSLRECMLKANSEPTNDSITFSVSGTITPLSELPALTDNGTTINGGGNITIDGNGANFNGLVIQSNNNVIRDMTVMRFSGAGKAGVLIDGGGTNTVYGCKIGNDGTNARANSYGIYINNGATWNTIGGNTPARRNIISGNGTGVYISGAATERNKVTGSYIGTNAAGTAALPNTAGGIIISGPRNTIGGGAGEGNVISGNGGAQGGIYLSTVNAQSTEIKGNYIGTNAAGTSAVPNTRGIYLISGANNTTIGGTNDPDRNIISGNTSEGILINGSTNNYAIGNYMGTTASGLSPLPNQTNVKIENGATDNFIGGPTTATRNVIAAATQDGVWLVSNQNSVQGNYIGVNKDGQRAAGMGNGRYGVYAQGSGNKIGGSASGRSPNLILRSGQAGVYVTAGTLNTISENVIYDNGALGIDLVSGGNANIARPTVSYARYSSPGVADVNGLSSCGSDCTVELYRADDTGAGIGADAAGGEGFAYLGKTKTDAGGTWSFTGIAFSGGDYVTATITDTNGNTSEFAANRKVIFNSPPIIISSGVSSNDISFDQSITLNAAASDPDGDPLTYIWSSSGLSPFSATNTASTQWSGPLKVYTEQITLTVTDGQGGTAIVVIPVRVGIKDIFQFFGSPGLIHDMVGGSQYYTIEFYARFKTGHMLRVTPETATLDNNIGLVGINTNSVLYEVINLGVYSETLTAKIGDYTTTIPIDFY